MKILILGGSGVFGGRLARLLADLAGTEMLICGRSLSRAEAFCAGFRGVARVRPMVRDRLDIAAGLAAERPDLVVDASGPFQDYGADPYPVIRACIAARIDYVDFADGAGFVAGVAALDTAARAAGIFVLSGCSSFPVLTAAVLREMGRTMDILAVEGGIAPSPHAGIGLNVMRAVLGYAGSPVTLWRNGGWSRAIGLGESRRFTIAVPGRLPLRNIRFSLVDVPDLRVIPPLHPALTDIWMGAGPVPEVLHRLLNLLAGARARFGLPSLAPLAGLFHRVLNLCRFGPHRGGMYLQAQGLRDGQQVCRTWHLLAEGDDGPLIPSMAIEGIVRRLLSGHRPDPGARPATGELELADYERLFAGRAIQTGMRDDARPSDPLYRRVLGPAFADLPVQVQALHDSTLTRAYQGTAEVRRGRGLIARAIARVIGFPEASASVPVRVVLSPEAGGERWLRDFGGRRFSSHQSSGTGRSEALLIERFGIIRVALALVIEGDRLFLLPRRWSALGLPLPRFLLPGGRSFETAEGGIFRFDVEIGLPFVGLVVAYRGHLRPVALS